MIKKLLFLLILSIPVLGQAAKDLFISEYVEGSSYNKYIEIYNGTGNTVDLSAYELQIFSNGSATPSKTFTLTGTLHNNSVIVYQHPSANIYSGATTSNGDVINFNGDDAVALVKSGSYVDIFGSIGEDPGSNWSSGSIVTKDKTLKRKSNISEGVTNSSTTGFPTLGTEWEMIDKDTHDLGTHQFDGAVTVTPPTAGSATNVTETAFTANWNSISGATGYFIDISEVSDFSSFVTGFENKDAGNVTSFNVTGLNPGVTYYYRARVQTTSGTSGNSNTITVTTSGNPTTTLSFIKRNALVLEGEGEVTFEIKINFPSSAKSTNAELVLVKGNAASISNYTTKSIEFAAGSDVAQNLTFTTTNDENPEDLEYLSFEVRNISGGNSAKAGDVSRLDITIVDDDQDKNSIYSSITSSMKDDELKTQLYNTVKGHTEFPYTSSSTDTWDILKESDQDQTDTTKVHLIYSGLLVEKDGHSANQWNREHVWAKSHGDFGTTEGEGTDLHNLRPAHPSVNSSKSNLDFDWGGSSHSIATECKYDSDSWEPGDEMKGDVARMIFYMATRYEGENGDLDLEATDNIFSSPNKEPLHGKLTTLLEWNRQDPPSAFEMRRNEIVYKYQGNRNPYIDNYLWADKVWSDYVSIKEVEENIPQDYFLGDNYPNPFNPTSRIEFAIPQKERVKVSVYNILGELVKTLVDDELDSGTYVVDFNAGNLSSGVYIYNIQAGSFNMSKKMLCIK
ncbi:MAG: endonuclease [Rhodothermaceae bacterium]